MWVPAPDLYDSKLFAYFLRKLRLENRKIDSKKTKPVKICKFMGHELNKEKDDKEPGAFRGVILVKIKINIFVKIKIKKSLELLEAVPGNAGVIHREDCLSKTEHGGEALQTNVYLI